MERPALQNGPLQVYKVNARYAVETVANPARPQRNLKPARASGHGPSWSRGVHPEPVVPASRAPIRVLHSRAAPASIRVSAPPLPVRQWSPSRVTEPCRRGPQAESSLVWVRIRTRPTRLGTCRARVIAPAAGPGPKEASAGQCDGSAGLRRSGSPGPPPGRQSQESSGQMAGSRQDDASGDQGAQGPPPGRQSQEPSGPMADGRQSAR